MKKSAIATAIAASTLIGSGAHAAIVSKVTDVQLYIGSSDIELPCNNATPGPRAPYETGLVFSGAQNDINMDGQICLDPGTGVLVALTFDLAGTHAASGSTFDAGTITIDADLQTGSGYQYYATVTATATTSIACRVNQLGHRGTNITHGLQVPPHNIISPLPGLWFAPSSPGINDAACVTTLLGQTAGLYLDGTLQNGIASDITDIQLYIGNFDLELPCNAATAGPRAPYRTGLKLSGIGGNINMDGKVCLDPGNGVLVALTFALSGTHAASGSTFNAGSVTIDIDAQTGSGYQHYATVTASTTPILCLVNQVGHLGTNITHGLQAPPVNVTSPLPGLWLPPASTGINDATCVTTLFGQSAGLYLDGTISN